MLKFGDKRFFLVLSLLNVVFSVGILGVLFVNRFDVLGLHWVFWLLAAYGFVVTPFMIFRLVSAYLYRPVADQGYRPKVSVVVPCFNDAAAAVDTVHSIFCSNYPRGSLEVVFVDDCSSDDSFGVVESYYADHVRCLEGSGCVVSMKLVSLPVNMGKRHAVVEGLRYCSGEVVVLVDSDTVLARDAVKNLVQPFVDPKVYCVCGNAEVRRVDRNVGLVGGLLVGFQKVWYNESFRVRKGVESLFGSVFCCSGVLAGYRADKLREVLPDFLSERFLGVTVQSGDDRRLTNLMLRLGGRSVFQSSAVAYTVAPVTVKKFVRQQVRWGRGSLRGMLFALSFFHRRCVGSRVLFYLTVFATFLSPVALVLSTFGLAVLGQWSAVVGYFLGLGLVAFLFGLTDRLLVSRFSVRDLLFRVGFVLVMFGLTFVYVYGWLTSARNTWGTR